MSTHLKLIEDFFSEEAEYRSERYIDDASEYAHALLELQEGNFDPAKELLKKRIRQLESLKRLPSGGVTGIIQQFQTKQKLLEVYLKTLGG
jgi:hypothetical protein